MINVTKLQVPPLIVNENVCTSGSTGDRCIMLMAHSSAVLASTLRGWSFPIGPHVTAAFLYSLPLRVRRAL